MMIFRSLEKKLRKTGKHIPSLFSVYIAKRNQHIQVHVLHICNQGLMNKWCQNTDSRVSEFQIHSEQPME